ncbi:SixA phosphatase family protein [Antarctobacter jejuensis]|uniref:SixA phosphatase family protein n=1 Tax=Antarctobacter jejuensis TaxID=1439938 RepID=UPI003FD01109
MKQLILLRHAKSDWSHNLSDHDRPLNTRGQGAAPAIGAWLRDKGYLPDEVLCSTATRTRETLDLLDCDAPVRFERGLYLAETADMLAILHTAKADSVLMLGHNPGIGLLARMLVKSPPAHPRFDAYPTCATLVARFDVDSWDQVARGTGTVVDFIVPRDLTD